MINQVLTILDAAAEPLPVASRYGLASLVGGRPHVHVGNGNFVPVAEDGAGSWSYWRPTGPSSVEPADIGEPCIGYQVTMPLRFVAWVDRAECTPLVLEAVNAIRASEKAMQTALGAVDVSVERIQWQIDAVGSQEFRPEPVWPTHKMLVNIDLVLKVEGDERCMRACDDIVSVLCRLVAAASLADLRACLGDRIEQLCDIDCPATTVNGQESQTRVITVLQGGNPVGTLNPVTGVVTVDPCPEACTDPLSVYLDWGNDRKVQVAFIPDRCAAEDVLLECNSPTDAVRVEGCGCPVANAVYAPDGTNRYTNYGETRVLVATGALPAQWEIRTAADVVFYRSVGTWDSPLDVEEWTVVNGPVPAPSAVVQATLSEVVQTSCGSCPVPWKLLNLDGDLLQEGTVTNPCALAEEGLLIAAPNATVFRDGEPYASVPSGGFVNVASQPCADASVTWDGDPLLSIPSGGTQDITCNTLVNAAYALDGGSVTGTYKVDGALNGREVFRLDPTHNFEYTGTRWRLVKPGSDYDAAPGSETKPWEADWSATPVTVTQATIGAYCDDCEPCEPVTVQLRDSAGNDIGAPDVYPAGTVTTKTAPDGTVRTTDGLTTVGAVKSNGAFDLPQSVIKYKDAANASQVTAASDTEFASGTLRGATEVPRRELKLSNGTGLGTFATVDRLIADTLPTCPVAAADSLVEITASGTYTPPANLREIVVFAQAAGGGGGGGRSNSTGGSANGGGAGGSGAYVIRRIPASDLTGPVTVTIGAVGAGGNGGNNGNGTDGGTAGDTSFGAFVIAKGGAGGQGATGTNVTPANTALASDCTPAFRPWASTGVAPAAQSGSTLNGVDGSAGGVGIAPRGGNGGGRILAGTAFVGGNGGGIYNNSTLTPGAAGASTAGANGSNGADNVKLDYMALHTTLTPTIGQGTAGGGGAYNASGNGGNGGTGGKGTGGAGGGGCINTATAGRGADGGAGFVVVLQRFNPA